MIDLDTHAQAVASVEQARAAWVQVWVSAISALATFGAVLAALGIPISQWRRQKAFTEATLLQASRTIISLHETLEVNLVAFVPGRGLSVVRVARLRLEHTIPIVREYRMITCLLALEPILMQTEQALERWTLHMTGQSNFSPEGFRVGMREQAEKAKAILHGYGDQRLERELKKIAKPFG